MNAKAKLITEMHSSCGCQVKHASEWLAAAQRDDTLLPAAFRAVFGKKLPTVQKLGQWLKDHSGKVYGDLRLLAIYSTNKKAFRYSIESQAETEARERQAHLKDLGQSVIDDDKLVRASKRLFKAAAEQEAKKRDAQKLAEISNLNIEVAPAASAPVEYETTTRIVDHARILQEPVRGRDGEPIIKKGEPTASPGDRFAGCTLTGTRYEGDKKIEEWQKPDGHVFENWVSLVPVTGWTPAGLHGRPTRAQLAARHHQHEVPANVPRPSAHTLPLSGVSGPNGIRQDTSGAESWHNRLLLKDF